MKKMTIVLIAMLFVTSLVTNLGVNKLSSEQLNLAAEFLGITILVWTGMLLYKSIKYIAKKLTINLN